MNTLTSNLLDNIIRKSTVMLFVHLGKSSLRADAESLRTLARVCRGWHESLTRLKKSGCKMSAIFNSEFVYFIFLL